MKIHELVGPKRTPRKRVGRGLSAGQGKTAGRGTKGQKARSGYKLPTRFEGGQSSLIQRAPKRRGFRSVHTKPLSLRIDRVLAKISDDKITLKQLLHVGLISREEFKTGNVKLVGTAETLRPLKLSPGITASKTLFAKLQTK